MIQFAMSPVLCEKSADPNCSRFGSADFSHSTGLDGGIPVCTEVMAINLNDFRWQRHCRGLFELPVAA